MNPEHTFANVFTNTTTTYATAKDYLLDVPHYHACGRAVGVSPYAGVLLGKTDNFEFELRRFIAGWTRTLHRLYREIRSFLLLDEREAWHMITFSLDAVKHTILIHEWYELMSRYQTARSRIQKRFGIRSNHVTT